MMSTKIKWFEFFVLLMIFFLSGCSGRGNPILPEENKHLVNESPDSLPVGVSDFDIRGNPTKGYGALGLFEITIDKVSLTGEIKSIRSASSTDVLEVVDITNFLKLLPCTDCTKIFGIGMDDLNNLEVKIGIKHPFDAGNISQPPTGKNRADLHVFNVEGLVIDNYPSMMSFPGTDILVSRNLLLNADGYSAYLDIVLDAIYPSEADIHPYILHFDDYTTGNFDPTNPMGFASVTDPPPTGNLVMAMGCDYDVQDYVFNLDDDVLNFVFAVGCTYGVSADTFTERFSPEYRVPQHLKKAASEIDIEIIDNNLLGGDSSSEAVIKIDIVDISHNVPIGTALNEMKADSSVCAISLEIPAILAGAKDVPRVNSGGTGHNPADPLTYEITIQNENSAEVGTYLGLVKVTDSYPTGTNELELIQGNDGISRVDPYHTPLEGLFAISEFATYMLFEIDVNEIPNVKPEAIFEPDPVEIYVEDTVDFDGTNSYDSDGIIVLYEFDYNWNGFIPNFNPDDSNSIGVITSPPYNTIGVFTAGLRVTDDRGGVDYDSVEVTVNEQPRTCPDAPYGGYTITENFTYDDDFHLGLMDNWETDSDQIIDADILSTGQVILIYSDLETSVSGELRYVLPDQSEPFFPVESGYPGKRGVSIDVDSENIVVFVTSSLAHQDATHEDEITTHERIAASDDFFGAVDPFVGSSSTVTVPVGARIAAIDIDEYDDVWVLDENNVMHRFEKSTDYAEDIECQFDLDITSSGAFNGYVHDFVIDFYNEAFFILTDASPKCELWRFECDGVYHADINGNPNPMIDVLPHDTGGIADIGIDNFNMSGIILTGTQDSQIIVVGGYYDVGWIGIMARVDSELAQLVTIEDNTSDGFTNVFIDPIKDEIWGFERGMWACDWTERWLTPPEWQ